MRDLARKIKQLYVRFEWWIWLLINEQDPETAWLDTALVAQ